MTLIKARLFVDFNNMGPNRTFYVYTKNVPPGLVVGDRIFASDNEELEGEGMIARIEERKVFIKMDWDD